MFKEFVTVTEQEKQKIEAWIHQTYGSHGNPPIEVSTLLLYKIHELEEKVARIEQQTKTHWAK